MKTVITFGTFDLLHIGHIRIINRAREYGDRLVVGVSTDALNFSKKGFYPIYNQDDRAEIVRNLACVNEVFFEESLEQKLDYIKKYGADILVMGNDWEGKFDWCGEGGAGCEVVYLPRTVGISTTEVKDAIIKRNL